ncbi:hypothetical protein [Desulfitobacterium sp. LBE]|uniref:hypothetical protein n=1 Tax=Desulfitobacterium sp. LBE TaxID=884086 RepID=UPI001A9B825F|nr:hypothetical protein [Desulfitobacterium sp. LBE]
MSNIKQHYKWGFPVDTNSYCFLYLKTAFNTCAYYIGEEKILEQCFDPIRYAILENTNCDDRIESLDMLTIWRGAFEKIPDKGHYVIIESTHQGVTAYVGFYSERICGKMLLSSQPIGNYFTNMLICDWQHRNEYTICLTNNIG